MSFRTLIPVLAACALVSSCGFHLRGNLPLPENLKVIAVTSKDRAFREQMVNALEASGAQVVQDKAKARAVLDVYDVKYERKVRTIDTRGKVTGYVVRYDVKYRVVGQGGKVLRHSHLGIQRDYNFNPDQVLQAEEEENSLKDDMLKELTQRIMRQLVTVASRTIGTPGPVELASA